MRTTAPALLLAGALALVTVPARADEPAVTVVEGLGTTVPLELLGTDGTSLSVVDGRGDADVTDPVGWGVAADVPGTIELASLGVDSRAWTGDVPTPGGVDLGVGWVHRRWGRPELLEVRSPTGSTVATSNLDAGGATWTWTYRGVQYLNDHDYGRQLQAALYVDGVRPGGGIANPTEAGDRYSNQAVPAELRHGSPVALAVTDGATQSTRAVPMEWRPWNGEGSALLWNDLRLGKDLTLDWRGAQGVARYRTVVELPEPVFAHLELPTAYLRGAFTRTIGVDAVTGARTPLHPIPYDTRGLEFVPRSGRGGVVAATPNGAHAMGIYGVTPAAGGPVERFGVHRFVPLLLPGGTGQYDADTMKLRALLGEDLPAGQSTFDTFVVTGTIDEVVSRMQWLAAGGDR